MPRQMPTTPGPRIRAQARGGSLLLTFPIGGRGSRHRRPLPDRPPTLQAFRSVLSETTSVSTRRLIKGSRSYLRRHGVQSRRAAISYHKVALAVYRKFCCARKVWRRTGRSPIPTPLRALRSLRRKSLKQSDHHKRGNRCRNRKQLEQLVKTNLFPTLYQTPKLPVAKATKCYSGLQDRGRH